MDRTEAIAYHGKNDHPFPALEESVISVWDRIGTEKPPFALCTVVETRGSTPRLPGSRMMVRADGSIAGTVGGGIGERDVIAAARALLAERVPPGKQHAERARVFPVEMWADERATEGMVCGGRMEVWIEVVDSDWPALVAARVKRGVMTTLVRTDARPDGPASGVIALLGEDGRPLQESRPPLRSPAPGTAAAPPYPAPPSGSTSAVRFAEYDGRRYCFERVDPARRLVIVGAGHIGVALARLAVQLDFAVTLVDDRPASALDGVDGAESLFGRDCGSAIADAGFPPGTHYALLSRGWRSDLGALRSVLRTEPGYVGMIGSRRRVETVFGVLRGEGLASRALDSVDAPIGADIGAETPAEIAVSIAAALIAHERIR